MFSICLVLCHYFVLNSTFSKYITIILQLYGRGSYTFKILRNPLRSIFFIVRELNFEFFDLMNFTFRNSFEGVMCGIPRKLFVYLCDWILRLLRPWIMEPQRMRLSINNQHSFHGNQLSPLEACIKFFLKMQGEQVWNLVEFNWELPLKVNGLVDLLVNSSSNKNGIKWAMGVVRQMLKLSIASSMGWVMTSLVQQHVKHAKEPSDILLVMHMRALQLGSCLRYECSLLDLRAYKCKRMSF